MDEDPQNKQTLTKSKIQCNHGNGEDHYTSPLFPLLTEVSIKQVKINSLAIFTVGELMLVMTLVMFNESPVLD